MRIPFVILFLFIQFSIVNAQCVISLATSNTNSGCDTANGTASVTSSGGTAPYTYLWNDPNSQTNPSATGLSSGCYTVTVIDSSNCSSYKTTTISDSTGPTSLISDSLDVTCIGGADGMAMVTVVNGIPPYTYLWSDGQSTSTATNLSAGSYCVTVTGGNNCISVSTVKINDPIGGITSGITSQTIPGCGFCDGDATVTATGGATPYTYLWNDISAQTTATANGLCAGIYMVTATDNNGCNSILSVTLINPGGMTSSITAGTEASCNGACDGEATVNVSGGTSSYTYQWNDQGLQSTANATGLCTGTFTVTTTDATGCLTIDSITIGEPGPIILTESHSDANCGQADGIAIVAVSGGFFPYSYLWYPGGQTTAFINNVPAGTYIVTVTDSSGCSENMAVTIADLNGPTATITNSDSVSCNGGNDGYATVNISVGTSPYIYQWDDPLNQITPTAGNLAVGIYVITATDTNGCIASTAVTVYEPATLSAAITWSGRTSCNATCDGYATALAIGGTGLYTYSWDDPANQTTSVATGLCVGMYRVTVTDANGCSVISSSHSINDMGAPVINTDSMVIYSSQCDSATGAISGIVISGTTPLIFNWVDGLDSIVGGNSQNLIDILSDSYVLTVTDSNSCASVSGPHTVYDLGAPIITFIATTKSCFGDSSGTASTSVIGGVAPYTYQWGDPALQTTDTVIGLSGGPLSVTVTDANNCTTSGFTSVAEPNPLEVITTQNTTICYGGSAEISATGNGGTPPFTYVWNNNLDSVPTNTVSPNITTTFTVSVIDANACSTSGSIIINVNPPISVITQDIVICEGDDAVISAVASGGNGSAYTYTWSNGFIGSQQSISGLTNDTSYSVIVTDGCSLGDSAAVNINVNPSPQVDFTITGAGCEPSVFAALSSPGNVPIVSWFWDFGDGAASSDVDSTTHVYSTAGTYDVLLVTVSDQGCVDSVLKIAAVTVFATPIADFFITQNAVILDPTLTSILTPTIDFIDASSANVDSLTWDFGGPASGANNTSTLTNPSHTYSDTGLYMVTQTVFTANGCMDNITHLLGICPGTPPCDIDVGITESVSKPLIGISPNPTAGNFILDFNADHFTKAEINIYQMDGQLLRKEQLNIESGTYRKSMDLSQFEKGVYLVRIITDNIVLTEKIIYH